MVTSGTPVTVTRIEGNVLFNDALNTITPCDHVWYTRDCNTNMTLITRYGHVWYTRDCNTNMTLITSSTVVV